jgi:POT family proton-dependent oligopeptide transporter
MGHNEADTIQASQPLPGQIAYIIGNEGCERFSFYGMRNILTQFLVSSTLLYGFTELASVEAIPKTEREAAAKEVFHTFVLGVYFFPLLGGWLSDRYLGKYRTILYLSLVYCAGNACLALFIDSKAGFFAGLFLIALGSGGIKPCVSAFVGDQFDETNKSRAKVVFDAFYWIINFGSFFATLIMPALLSWPRVAFGIPGLLMFVATVVFWLGRRKYICVPPSPPHPDSFLQVANTALFARGRTGSFGPGLGVATFGGILALAFAVLGCVDLGRSLLQLRPMLGVPQFWCLSLVALIGFGGAGVAWQLDRARGAHPDEAVDGVRSVLRILVLFALVTPFWSLFDQKASTWVLQAASDNMTKPSWFQPSQMQALNPLLVMLLIPFNNIVLYPALRRIGFEPTALRRMGFGIALAGLSWIAAGTMQMVLDSGASLSITWQIVPYVLLTFGEIFVSATGLEFAYSQAPAAMKGAIMAFWSLSVTVGNLWVLLVNAGFQTQAVKNVIAGSGLGDLTFQMYFFAAFAFAAALGFGLYAARYTLADHYRKAA